MLGHIRLRKSRYSAFMKEAYYKSPLGYIKISYGKKIKKIEFTKAMKALNEKNDLSNYFFSQILEYLGGKRRNFEKLALLDPGGTDFQRSVWAEILKIPYSSSKSYKDLAIKIKKPKAFQAVGTAVSKNPIGIIIPCHRVIKSDGSIGEYAYGKDIKRRLLEIEGLTFI